MSLRVAVVGCGEIAPVHVGALLKCGMEIVALCDIDTVKAEKLRERFSINEAKIYNDYITMLKSEKLDSVHICTPHYLHAPMIIEALKQDINVFTEKPLAISEQQIKDIFSSADKSKAKVGVCFQNRYLDAVMATKKIVQNENVSNAFFKVVWSRERGYFDAAPWRGKLDMSGRGCLINQGIHTLDLLIWFLGAPKFIQAEAFRLKGLAEVDDTVSGSIEFENASAGFFVTTAAADDKQLPVTINLEGKRKIELIENRLLIDGKEEVLGTEKNLLAKNYWGAGHNSIIADYYDCLKNGKKFMLDEHEGAKALIATLKVYESHGKRIKADL